MSENKTTPFTYNSYEMIRRKFDEARGISDRRLQELWQQGILLEEDLILIGFLYRLTYLTGHLIDECFWLPGVEQKFKRLPKANGKSAYTKAIRRLEQYGVIETLQRTDDDGAWKGQHIYKLTSGAYIWYTTYYHRFNICDKNVPFAILSQAVLRPDNSITDEEILEIMSLNQHLIRSISRHGMNLLSHYRFFLNRRTAANFVEDANDNWILVLSVKGQIDAAREKAMRYLVTQWIDSTERVRRKGYILILTDDLSTASSYWSLVDQSYHRRMLFATDYSVYAEGPFQYLIRFKTGTEYEKLSLNFTDSEEEK